MLLGNGLGPRQLLLLVHRKLTHLKSPCLKCWTCGLIWLVSYVLSKINAHERLVYQLACMSYLTLKLHYCATTCQVQSLYFPQPRNPAWQDPSTFKLPYIIIFTDCSTAVSSWNVKPADNFRGDPVDSLSRLDVKTEVVKEQRVEQRCTGS